MPHIHDLIDFVVNVFLVRNGRVLLVDHRELGTWLPPGGHIELEEDTDQALLREIEEETGLTPHDIEIVAERPELGGAKSLWAPRWLNIHSIKDRHRHIALLYLARAKTDQVRLADREHRDIRWLSSLELDDPAFNTPADIRFYGKEAIRLLS